MKKILFIVNVDWFFLSHRLPIAVAAIKSGYQVHIATTLTKEAPQLNTNGLIVHPLEINRSNAEFFSLLRIVWQVYCICKEVKPDIVHLITVKPNILGGLGACLARVPAVVFAISGLGFIFMNNSGWRVRFMKVATLFLYRLVLRHPNRRIIFQNSSDRKELLDAARVSIEDTVLVRGSGISIADFLVEPEPDGVPVVAMACRLLRDKGVFEFVDAARLLKNRGLLVRFWLIGEVDLENPSSITNQQLASWKSEGLIECLGHQKNVPQLYAKAKIVVLPSYREGLPKTLIEAAACGRSVITTDVPGCRDAIEPNITGLLVPARNPMALADAIESLLTNDKLRQSMGCAGRKLAEREFQIETVIAAHLAIYRQLLVPE
jgi:glycosyltransferase involved in cell wall biosynthesis